jgi:hypothetical protein
MMVAEKSYALNQLTQNQKCSARNMMRCLHTNQSLESSGKAKVRHDSKLLLGRYDGIDCTEEDALDFCRKCHDKLDVDVALSRTSLSGRL